MLEMASLPITAPDGAAQPEGDRQKASVAAQRLDTTRKLRMLPWERTIACAL
jgi:hypothetical protein